MSIEPEIVVVLLVTIGMVGCFIFGYNVGYKDAKKNGL